MYISRICSSTTPQIAQKGLIVYIKFRILLVALRTVSPYLPSLISFNWTDSWLSSPLWCFQTFPFFLLWYYHLLYGLSWLMTIPFAYYFELFVITRHCINQKPFLSMIRNEIKLFLRKNFRWYSENQDTISFLKL